MSGVDDAYLGVSKRRKYDDCQGKNQYIKDGDYSTFQVPFYETHPYRSKKEINK
jgi:hypothetical protein